jgi:P4 family phage/plasmid primase-like protien
MSEKKISKEFQLFLKEHERASGSELEITGTSINRKRGYHIPFEELENFFRMYKDNVDNGVVFSLTEFIPDIAPITIDIDLKFLRSKDVKLDKNVSAESESESDSDSDSEIEDGDHLHEQKFIAELVRIFNKHINEVWKVNDNNMYCFTMQRKHFYIEPSAKEIKLPNGEPHKIDVYKDGLHLIYPYIIVKPEQFKLFRERVIKDPEFSKLIQTLNDDDYHLLTTDVKKIFDKPKNWLLYGSCKFPDGKNRYELTDIFDANNLSNNPKDIMDSLDFQGTQNLAEFLSVRRHMQKDRTTRLTDEAIDILENRSKQKIQRKKRSDNYEAQLLPSAPEEIQKYVDLLDVSRLNNYSEWINIGRILHDIDPYDNEGNKSKFYNMYLEWTKKSEYFKDEQYVKNKWNSFKTSGRHSNPITVKSLMYYAKEDNPEECSKIQSSNLVKRIMTTGHSNAQIAKIMYALNCDKFITANPVKKIWYYFDGINWLVDEGGATLRNSFDTASTEVRSMESIIMDAINCYSEMIGECESEEESKKLNEKKNDLIKLKTQTEGTTFRNNVMTELAYQMYNKNFTKECDTNPALLACKNGVLDLNSPSKEGALRDADPSDYLTKNTNIDYIPYYKGMEYEDEINDFMSKVFVDEDIREYMWFTLARALHGKPDHKFHLWDGRGGNGKTFFSNLIKRTLGDYAVTGQITLLTTDNPKSGQTDPDLFDLKGARIAFFEEPKKGARLNDGRVKTITGGTELRARPLWENKLIGWEPHHKTILLENSAPEFSSDDGGLARRFAPVEFRSNFSDEPTKGNKYQFYKDDTLEEKFDLWAPTLFSMLVDRFFTLRDVHKMKVPEGKEVRAYKKAFENRHDKIIEFVRTIIKKTDQTNDVVDITELYEHFAGWREKNYPGIRFKPSKREFIEHIQNKMKFKNMRATKFSGYVIDPAFFGNGDSDDEGENVEHNVVDVVS